SLRDNHIYAIEEDGNYNLWVGCVKGLSVYNPATSRFSVPTIVPWNNPTPVVFDGGVWVIRTSRRGNYLLAGSQDKGLLFFEGNTRVGMQIPLYDLKGKEGNYTVSSIEIDSVTQQAWVFVQQAGLYRFDLKSRRLIAVNSGVKYADGLKLHGSQSLWI